MAKSNKQCHVCGKEYQYCSTCQYIEPSYKELVCSDECDAVWQALSKNGVGLASAKETVDVLSKIKMPETLKPGIQEHIDRLKAEVKPVAKRRPVVVEEPATIEESQEAPVEVASEEAM